MNVRANRLQNNTAVHGSAASSVQGDAVIPESSRSQHHKRSFTLHLFFIFLLIFFVPAQAFTRVFAFLEINCIAFLPRWLTFKIPWPLHVPAGQQRGKSFWVFRRKTKGMSFVLLDSTNWEQKTTDAVDKRLINHILGTNLKSISARKIPEPLQWQQINNHFSF